MLIIGDVHINSKKQKDILENIDSFIEENSEEKNIVFLWDYVYHFSYDRNALFWLFSIFIKHFKKWKNIYVLAGNHDRISESFVFQEAKTSFDLLNESSENKLYFITKPLKTEIDWNKVFFLPYNHEIYNEFENYKTPKNDIEKLINDLWSSDKKNENFSAWVNSVLYENIKDEKEEIFVFHHYYFANTAFPGQKAKFNYNNVAVSDLFFDDFKNLYFITWHLHQWFVYKNYFCAWSVWSSSFLEQNQLKHFFRMDLSKKFIKAYEVNINPFLWVYDLSKRFDEKSFENLKKEIRENNHKHFQWWVFDFHLWEVLLDIYPEKTWIIFYWENIEYDKIYDIIDEDFFKKVKDIKIRKKTKWMDEIASMALDTQKDLENSISNWKDILIDFLKQKYNDDFDKYHKKLKDLKIL